MSAVTATVTPGLRPTRVLHPLEVVDDESLNPGAIVWMAEPWLEDTELDRFDQAARAAAMARHPAGRARHLRVA